MNFSPSVPGNEHKDLYMPGKCSITKLHIQLKQTNSLTKASCRGWPQTYNPPVSTPTPTTKKLGL